MKTLSLKPLSLAGAALATTLMAGALHAAPLAFVNNTITAHIPAKDIPGFKAAVGQTLNQGADGAATTWRSQYAKANRPITVVLTPKQTAQGQATRCRLLDAQVQQGAAQEQWQYWFCQQTDGSWKASSQP